MSFAQAQPTHPPTLHGATQVLREHWRFIAAEFVLLAATLVLAVLARTHPGPFPGDLGIAVGWEKLIRPDKALTTIIEFFGNITWEVPATLIGTGVVLLFALFRRWLDIVLSLSTFALADGTNYVIMHLVQRPRPTGAGLHVDALVGVPSFPSGHVEHALAFYGIVLFLTFQVTRPHFWLWIGRSPLIVLIVMMGPSRLVTGEHWPSDILGALLWGGVWLLAAIQVYPWAARRWPQLIPGNEHVQPIHESQRRPVPLGAA